MKNRIVVDIAAARRTFRYDAETGLLTRCGAPTGSVTKYGYLRVKLGATNLMAHRVAWALHFSEEPPVLLDHINGEKLDNRIENLRPASRGENARNRKRHRNSSTGVKGVYPSGASGYRAAIRVDGVLLQLGTFRDKEAARLAYAKAAKLHHREFARCD